MASRPSLIYAVERDVWGPERADVALIGRPAHHGLRGRFRPDRSERVAFERSFCPRTELNQLEHYATQLAQIASYMNAGTFGCFIAAETRDGTVEIRLYERWFDGERLHCDELAGRAFNAVDEGATVASAEFRAQLEEWAERRNTDRMMREAEERATDDIDRQRASESADAAAELSTILRYRREQSRSHWQR